tara:strand:+ start:311 stop:862 length:552 start_codon:yes stop_codon:yes gene_type:complete
MDLEQLKKLLADHGVDISAFGIGKAKTLANLLEEVNSGETQLEVAEGILVRSVGVVSIDVYCRVGAVRMRLTEDRQEFLDGRVRKRDYLYGAVSEKMNPGEEVTNAIGRGLAEELKVSNFSVENLTEPIITSLESPSYPGLQSKYTTYEVSVNLDVSDYRPEGYVEEQGDKSTFFVWEKSPKT